MQDEDFESEETWNAYRECARLLYDKIYMGVQHVRNAKTSKIGLAQIRFALDIEKRSMREVAAALNCEIACLSKGALEFVKAHELPTPRGMKSEDSRDEYAEARCKNLKEKNNEQSTKKHL